ncbi:MAG: DinB family protein [Acidobacteriia bacterium]|nr:DinB family protein [Terriglobia bacterium]
MALSQSLLPEFDAEMANTRKTLERVPDGKFDFKPHPKSGSMGWLAGHLANLPLWAAMTLQQDSLDIAPAGGQPFKLPETKNTKQVLEVFDQHVAEARKGIAAATDEQLMRPWSLLKTGQTIMTMPKIAVLRSFVLNHIIHHRAQMGVYLRLNDIPVPSIYGPSADEGSF